MTPKTLLHNFTSWLLFYFLSSGKNKYVTLGMLGMLLRKYIRKSKLVHPTKLPFLL